MLAQSDATQLDVQDLAQRLARDVATRAEAADREGRLPAEDVQALKSSGFTLLSVPREYGGYGLSLRDCTAALLGLAQGSASTAMVAAMQLHIFGNAAEKRCWPEAAFERLCRAAVQDGALVNAVASEPNLGSPSRGGAYATYAERNGAVWIINGRKTWSTGGKHLTHLLTRLDFEGTPIVLIVPNHLPGIEWMETWNDSLSLRASDTHDVYFRNVTVPEENLLESATQRDELPNGWFALLPAAVYLGAALAARQAVIRYALERVPTALGRPIATLPAIQRQIGEVDVALQAAQALLLDVCTQWETKRVENFRAAYVRLVAAKVFANETAAQVTMKCLRIAGGSSITNSLPLERYFRDSQAGFSHPPAGDAAYESVGQAAIASQQS